MSEIKLLPCPFCGGEAKLCNGSNEIVGSQYLIRCKSLNCTVRPKTEWYETKEEAIKTWNTRKPMEQIIHSIELIRDCVPDVEFKNGCNASLHKIKMKLYDFKEVSKL